MGQEIEHSRFTEADFADFEAHLGEETALLEDWFQRQAFSTRDHVAGCELEAWLIDSQGSPAPHNDAFLKRLNNPLVVPELARFNVELNTPPVELTGAALSRMYADLATTYASCQQVAAELATELLAIGTLPTLTAGDLTPENMSDQKRYRALNEQVLRQRHGRPLHLDIRGREHLKTEQRDVMLEAATTSFQIHLKVAPALAVRYYNLAQILSAPMVAVSANSPYLFGHDLWSETRIPLFEQSVEVGGFAAASQGPLKRVSFGSGYAHSSLFECFQENRAHFPVLLPMCSTEPAAKLPHLRLHNGTIWRWNRPLIGFDDDGMPHIRIEHRVVPAGPTLVDAVANAALFFGLMHCLGQAEVAPALLLPFSIARDNFYAAARDGLDAQITWRQGRRVRLQALLNEELIPVARKGLQQLGVDEADIDAFLGVIAGRASSGRNGAVWQRDYVARYGPDWAALTHAYRDNAKRDQPVHSWPV